MAHRIYTDKDGIKRVFEVPAQLANESLIRHGILLGPPDLSPTIANIDKRRELSNRLCDAGIIDYDTMNGRRPEVHAIIRDLFPEEDSKALLIGIIAIYQQEFYGETEV